MKNMYAKTRDWKRLGAERVSPLEAERYRDPVRVDSARVLHSAAFRRLAGKTQLFPSNESDFFRNRLTHSLEVGQIGKSIAIRLNNTEEKLGSKKRHINPDLVELAGWCHDLGHPPFGHTGEYALAAVMAANGGFEGNGQTLRILSRLEKKVKACPDPSGIHISEDREEDREDRRHGLNLTVRTLASVLKYDHKISAHRTEKEVEATGVEKGFFEIDRCIVDAIKEHVRAPDGFDGEYKTVECQIMDIADDIAYSTYDLEDAFKAGFLNPHDLMYPPTDIMDKVIEKVSAKIGEEIQEQDVGDVLFRQFEELYETGRSTERLRSEDEDEQRRGVFELSVYAYQAGLRLADDGHLRTRLTSQLVGSHIRGVRLSYNEEAPWMSKVYLEKETLLRVEVMKNMAFEYIIQSPDLRLSTARGKRIVTELFEVLQADEGNRLLPEDVARVANRVESKDRARVICDFIACMTDRYASEYHGRIFSDRPVTVFKRVR